MRAAVRLGTALLPALVCFAPIRAAEAGWICVQSPHFTVLTPGAEAQARTWATTMEGFYRAMNAGFEVKADHLPVVTVLLFKNDRDFRPFKPLEKGKPAKLAGFFARSEDINVIALSLGDESAELRQKIQHEAVHWYFSSRPRRLPLWMEEGLAEVYSTFHMSDATHGVFGDIREDHLRLLRKKGLMPIEQLMQVTSASIQYNETQRTGLFYAESWLLVHYLSFGRDNRGAARLDHFEGLVDRGASLDEALRLGLGANATDLQEKLQRYLSNGAYGQAKIAIAAETASTLRERPANRSEIEVAFGSTLMVTRSIDQAEDHLQFAAQVDPLAPRPLECLGLVALRRGDLSGASRSYRQAAALGSQNPLVYYDLALLRLGIRPQALDQVNMGISADVRPSLSLLRTALEHDPTFLPAYRIFAWMICSAPTASIADILLLQRGCALAPFETLLSTGLGAAEIKAGMREQGRQRLKALIAASEASKTPASAAFAKAILQTDDRGQLNARLSLLFAERRYAEVVSAIAAFEINDSERAAADLDQLEAIRRDAENFQIIAGAEASFAAGQKADAAEMLRELLKKPDISSQVRGEAERVLEIWNLKPAPSLAPPNGPSSRRTAD